jgi:hypothetical protein
VDVTDFGAWQAPRSEGPSLAIEPCDGNLSSAKTFSGFVPECSLVGRQDMGNSKIMIMDDGIADAGERNEGALLGLRSGRLNRRSFLFGSAVGLGALGLAGCATSDDMMRAEAAKWYARAPNEKFPIPAVDVSKIDPKYFRQTVRYDTKEAPGTIIIDPGNYYVYRIEGDGNATRYGANVGRAGFLWSGEAYVGRKAEWPIWTPPKEMILRQPEARKYAGGMPREVWTIRSAPARSISIRTAFTRSSRSTAPATPSRSGPTLRAAVPASSVRT